MGSPTEFVEVLRSGFRGVKAGDPAAVVVSGGISGNNADWVGRMYAAGGQQWFDVLGVHPYLDPADAPPDEPAENKVYRMTSVSAVRAEMIQVGDSGKPIWFTEFGWTTSTAAERPGVDEATQARYLRQSIAQIQTDYPYVAAAFWFTMRDRDDSTPYENAFGLLRLDGMPKPAYQALQDTNEWLLSRPGA